MKKVSFLGLGVMGFPMAGHLADAGYPVTVFNRTTSKAADWCARFAGKQASTIEEAASDADLVIMCVGNDKDVEEVADKAINAMHAGSILVDHTTASADIARLLARKCAAREIGFLDAPISGGQAGAQNAQLTVMVGGQESVYDSALPVLDVYARHVQLIGENGSGQLAKMMNQICIAGIVQGLAEALHFGEQAGLDCGQVIDVISKGAAQSWQMDNRAATMIEGKYEFGFAVDWMRKDLNIALQEARKNGSTLALTALVDQYYADVQKSGGNRWDTSSLLTRLQK